MVDRPISVLNPSAAPLLAGTLTRLHRPPGLMSLVKSGDRLWLREHFFLPRRFMSPLQAHAAGAEPIFALDLHGNPLPQRGAQLGLVRRRFARELPRVWHRAHLAVEAVGSSRLQDITEAEIRAAGFVTREGFAAAWDRNLSLSSWGMVWAENPSVVVIEFHLVRAPVPPPAIRANRSSEGKLAR